MGIGPASAGTGSADLTGCTSQVLATGASGSCVKALQESLQLLNVSLSDDGQYGGQTVVAVKYFQQWDGLPVDGIAGPVTLSALDFVTNSPRALSAQLPTMPPSGVNFAPDGQSLSNCGTFTTTCTFYFGREATAQIDTDLSSPGTNLAIGASSGIACEAINRISEGEFKLAGLSCTLLSAAILYDIGASAKQAHDDQDACLAIKDYNYGAIGESLGSEVVNSNYCVP